MTKSFKQVGKDKMHDDDSYCRQYRSEDGEIWCVYLMNENDPKSNLFISIEGDYMTEGDWLIEIEAFAAKKLSEVKE